jgi:GNAT superfamily N-acetyltransferase
MLLQRCSVDRPGTPNQLEEVCDGERVPQLACCGDDRISVKGLAVEQQAVHIEDDRSGKFVHNLTRAQSRAGVRAQRAELLAISTPGGIVSTHGRSDYTSSHTGGPARSVGPLSAPSPERSGSRSLCRRTHLSALLSSGLTTVIVADAAGWLVSSCTLAVIPNLTRGTRPYGVIENVVTHPEHRRIGWGHAVLQAALAIAWTADCYKVTLATGSQREATLQFYEGAGFLRGSKTYFEIRRP